MKRIFRVAAAILVSWAIFLFLQSVLSRFVVYSEEFSTARNLLPAFAATAPTLLIAAFFCRALIGSHRPFVISVAVFFLLILILQLRESGGIGVESYSTLMAVILGIIFFVIPLQPRTTGAASAPGTSEPQGDAAEKPED